MLLPAARPPPRASNSSPPPTLLGSRSLLFIFTPVPKLCFRRRDPAADLRLPTPPGVFLFYSAFSAAGVARLPGDRPEKSVLWPLYGVRIRPRVEKSRLSSSLMLALLISLLSVLVLLSLNLLPSWANELRLFPHLLCREFLYIIFVCWLKNSRHIASVVLEIPSAMSAKKKVVPVAEVAEETVAMSVLDLPDLTLECILGKLPPASLSNMAAVCSSLKDICRSDHIWEKHMKEKWGTFLGLAAQREWQAYVSSRKEKDRLANPAGGEKAKGYLEFLSCMLPFPWMRPKVDDGGTAKKRGSVLLGSTMSWYLALESGRFWFPAQVYNRENGHVGFMLSCYDAELSYDSRTNTFHARYPPHGRRTVVIEEGVQWDRLRAPPINTPAHDLHVSDCLNDLHPGDHIEIQWRRSKEFPYGWWYGVAGHLESCDRNERHCRCHDSGKEFIDETVKYYHLFEKSNEQWRVQDLVKIS